MQEMFGKELYIIYQDKTNFGLNMRTWKKFQENFKKLEKSLENGWNGFLDKKLGWLILSFNREWDSLKKPRMFFINILRLIQLQQHILKWLNLSLKIEINKRLERYLNRLQLILVLKLWMKFTLLNLVNLRLNNTNMIVLDK